MSDLVRTSCLFSATRWPISTRASFASDGILEFRSNFNGLSISKCPIGSLPRIEKGRWGDGLTAEDMKRCRWLKPQLVAAIEFLEWTPEARLRHPKFVSLRDDKRAVHVIREGAQGEGIFRL